MLKINRIKIVLLSMIIMGLFSNCATNSDLTNKPAYSQKDEIKFKDENFYLLVALDSEMRGNYQTSSDTYLLLYEKTDKQYYLNEYVKILNYEQKYEDLIKFVNENKENPDFKVEEVQLEVVQAYANLSDNSGAIKLLLELIKKSPTEENYKLLAELYFREKSYENSLIYLQKAYILNNSVELMESISRLLYVYLGRKEEAILNLETHTRIYGCNVQLCISLANIYGDSGQLDSMLRIYRNLYDQNLENQDVYAQKVIDILKYKNDYENLIIFLEETKFDNDLLLQLYSLNKKFRKGFDFSKELFTKTRDLKYLAQNAIFEYEINKNDPKTYILKSIISKLKSVVKDLKDPLYLNYLGYLMIDHNIDTKDGLEYVKEAIKITPDSIFFVDSLAWGYYKLGKCDEAYKNMKEVIKELGLTDDEIISHWRAIDKCAENFVNKK